MGPGEEAYRKAQHRRFIRLAVLLYTSAAMLTAAGFTPTLAEWYLGVPAALRDSGLRDRLGVPLLSILIAVFLIERQLRAFDFLDGKKARWLRTTPWHPGRSLPFTERALQVRDAILLAPIAALCLWITPRQWWMPWAAVGLAMVIRWLLENTIAKQFGVVLVSILILLGCMFDISAPAKAVIVAASFLILLLGALRAKPAFDLIEPEPTVDRFGGLPGWIRRQMPAVQHNPRPHGFGLVIAFAVFWTAFCFLQIVTMDSNETRTALAVSFALALIIAVARWGIYVGRHHAPISLRGRFRERHWLIPSHDRVLIAPLGSTVAVLIVLALCLKLNVPFPVSIALLPAIGLAICIEAGPSLRNWTLTGQHHVPRTAMKEISFDSTPTARRR